MQLNGSISFLNNSHVLFVFVGEDSPEVENSPGSSVPTQEVHVSPTFFL